MKDDTSRIETDSQVELPKSTIPLSDLKDKTLLFVNVASKCGMLILPRCRFFSLWSWSLLYGVARKGRNKDDWYTGLTPQYTELQALHEKYGAKGLVIIGFPCNQVCPTQDWLGSISCLISLHHFSMFTFIPSFHIPSRLFRLLWSQAGHCIYSNLVSLRLSLISAPWIRRWHTVQSPRAGNRRWSPSILSTQLRSYFPNRKEGTCHSSSIEPSETQILVSFICPKRRT
jgi:hypothetical protein